MLPSTLRCTACMTEFNFPGGPAPSYAPELCRETMTVDTDELLAIPRQPIWCMSCNLPSFAEELGEFEQWETIGRLIRDGKKVVYPFDNQLLDMDTSLQVFESFYKHRQQRKSKQRGRCLCCGGYQYIELADENLTLIHESCENSRLISLYSIFGGVFRSSAYKIYDTDGMLVGCLGSIDELTNRWTVISQSYEEAFKWHRGLES